MPWKFNPFSVTLDQTSSGGGGGASYLDGEVATYADLPLDGTAAADSAWLVRSASGSWLTGRRPAGIYIRTATAGVSRDADYTYAGIFPDVFSDANFVLYDDADSTKNLQFQLSGLTTGTTRTLTAPDANGTIALNETFAAPPAIGNATPNSGAFTTLTGSTQIIGPQGSTVGTTSDCSISLGAANTGFRVSSTQIICQKQGASVWYANNSSRFVIAAGMVNGVAIEATGAPIGFTGRATGLTPEATGTLALVSTTQAQTFRIYNTLTNATNFERLNLRWDSNEFIIDAEAGSVGGTLRGIKIGSATSSLLGFYGVTPVDQPATVADPAGGGTIDTEARTAIGEVIDRLQELGLIA